MADLTSLMVCMKNIFAQIEQITLLSGLPVYWQQLCHHWC